MSARPGPRPATSCPTAATGPRAGRRAAAFLRALACLVIFVLLVGERAAEAQLQYGQIQGTVRSRDDGRALSGVTVVVSGPALQGDQTELTDRDGRYLVTQLPPGDSYVVRYYFSDVVVERPGIRVTQNKTLTIPISMPTYRGQKDKYVVRERAPNVDTASANTGVEINQELLQNTPVRGRTFESVLSLAPGSADVAPRQQAGGDVGVSFGGSAGNENAVIIDGLNTTDVNTGMMATQLHQQFIKEVNVITGGYQAEYGRAGGAVVSIVTKSGSNEFHGSLFTSVLPFQAQARDIARLGEAIATRTRTQIQYDFGFELGGPIVKDRIWFFVGFAPTFTNNVTERAIRTLLDEPDPDYRDPPYLSSPVLSDRPRLLAKRAVEVPGRTRELDEARRLYNWIAKLQLNLSPDHNITLGYIGAPEFRSDYLTSYLGSYSASYKDDVGAMRISRATQIHDATVRYTGKLFSHKLQVEVLYGYHYQSLQELPDSESVQQVRYRAPPEDPNSLADFEDIPECQRRLVNGRMFNPCPVTDYSRGGFGQYTPLRILERHALTATATLFLKLAGNHAFKLGFEFEDNRNDNTKKYTGSDFNPGDPFSGHLSWDTNGTGDGLRISRGYALEKPYNFFGIRGEPCAGQDGRYCFNQFRAITETRNYALYLRDSWNLSFLPGFVINAGLRWEPQEIFAVDGSKQIAIYDNLAPRVGLVYDVARNGRSKVYFNYGRFYQSIPMDINDRIFSGEGFLRGRGFATDCARAQLSPGGRPLPVPQRSADAPCSLAEPRLSGAEYGLVAPNLKGQYVNEIVVGAQYDVGLDIVLGAYYTFRNLGSIVEDMSVDGGTNYFIANPGQAPDPAVAAKLEREAKRAQDALSARPDDAALQGDAAIAQARLDVYRANVLFPTAKRDYHAVTLLLSKRLSKRFSILANYTYSRLLGNFPGLFSPYVNQLDPNITSQFDIIDLTVNRDGPLNNDRPHNVKATGFYVQPVGGSGSLTLSLTFTAISGRPIQALGAHASYGTRQVLILPNGSAGRTPMVTQLDLHIGYDQRLTQKSSVSVFLDIVNLLNQQAITNVDDEYTSSLVSPIVYGRPSDLKHLATNDGTPLVINSNYGQPTAFQTPLYLRCGARLAF
ncbi:MAG: TonB-dependent receptor [Polyangia bacterium]